MGDCVPDWDEMAGGTEVGISLENLEHLLKEKWDNVELNSQINNLASLSDHDVNQGSWGDTALCTSLRAHLEHLDSHRSSVCDAVTPSHPSGGKYLSSDLRKGCSGDGGANIHNPQDDELVSWLQPLEEPVEKEHHHSLTFNSPHDFHGDPGAACHLQQKGVPLHRMRQPAAASRDGANPGLAFSSGAGGAVGVLPHGGEVFNRFRTLEPVMPKRPCLERPSNVVHAPDSNSNHIHRVCSPRVSSLLATSAVEPVPEPASMLNFPHFSRPAALVKANLQSLGVSCIPTSQPLLRHNTCPKGSASASPLPFTLSARSGAANSGSPAEIDMCRESSYSHTGLESEGEGSGDRASKQPSCAGSVEGNYAMHGCFPSASLTCDSNDKGLRTSSHEASEATFGSTSGGSGTSMVENVTATPTNMKRRLAEEDSEAPVDDAKDESVDLKKTTLVRSSATKRSRAAEVHNLSERRRRDRINEKMRALQDLIPNSNKTDKASMLDEAIEYLKMLQLHLQMMYVRTGIKIPPMILPPGLQAHESPVCAPDPNWGVSIERGKAPGSGMGLGRMDMIAPGQRPVPPFYGPTHVLGGSTSDDQLQTTPLDAEAWNVCLSHQDAQPANVDMYNTFMRHRQQQFLHQRYYQQ